MRLMKEHIKNKSEAGPAGPRRRPAADHPVTAQGFPKVTDGTDSARRARYGGARYRDMPGLPDRLPRFVPGPEPATGGGAAAQCADENV